MGRGDMACRNASMRTSFNENRATTRFRRRTSARPALFLILLGTFVLCGIRPELAKDKTPQTRTVKGTVFDGSDNPISGAAVNLTDVQTGKALAIYSQEDGQYQYSDLRFDHDYTVQATYKGASSETRKVSMFDTRTHLVMNLTIGNNPNK
ncbi:MAG TPA: carboxypeptidase-like regulatory domain-containing protein [Terriglobia bacterium]|nr:carboxypeptidase-like regulatory domain-containing protein [Terriglobia bacterium]